MNAGVNRREFLATVAAAQGAFVLGFWVPSRADAQTTASAAWYEEPATPEINAWIVIAPDDTVTIRIAQTELGQGVWTSNAMMVCEELQCDWSEGAAAVRVREPRRAREGARVDAEGPGQRRHRSEGRRRADVRQSRSHGRVRAFPTASIGACGRTRRRRSRTAATTCSLPAPKRASGCCWPRRQLWNVPVAELTAKDSVITHASSGRTTTYGQIAASRRARRRIRIPRRSPSSRPTSGR